MLFENHPFWYLSGFCGFAVATVISNEAVVGALNLGWSAFPVELTYQSLHSLNALHSFNEKVFFFTGFCFVASTSPNSVPRTCYLGHRIAKSWIAQFPELRAWVPHLVGFRTQTQNAAFFERKGPERKPWPRGKPLKRKTESQCVFWTLAFYHASP